MIGVARKAWRWLTGPRRERRRRRAKISETMIQLAFVGRTLAEAARTPTPFPSLASLLQRPTLGGVDAQLEWIEGWLVGDFRREQEALEDAQWESRELVEAHMAFGLPEPSAEVVAEYEREIIEKARRQGTEADVLAEAIVPRCLRGMPELGERQKGPSVQPASKVWRVCLWPVGQIVWVWCWRRRRREATEFFDVTMKTVEGRIERIQAAMGYSSW